MSNKILLVGIDRKYFYADKDEKNNMLKRAKNYVLTTDVIPYGFDFKFGRTDGITFAYGKYGSENMGLPEEDVIKKNLDLTIKGLEDMVKKAKADFVLIDDLGLSDVTFCGRGQLLIKR